MNVIRFEVRPGSPEDIRPDTSAGYFDEVRILIDGRDLVEIVREVEAPFAAAEGATEIAGSYIGLRPKEVCAPSLHFWGKLRWSMYQYGARTQILQCQCREPGCWPLVCRIKINLKTIRWCNFQQPFRVGKYERVPWSYEALGPFEFDRRQYEDALNGIGSVN